jgi:hypothetical protein
MWSSQLTFWLTFQGGIRGWLDDADVVAAREVQDGARRIIAEDKR